MSSYVAFQILNFPPKEFKMGFKKIMYVFQYVFVFYFFKHIERRFAARGDPAFELCVRWWPAQLLIAPQQLR